MNLRDTPLADSPHERETHAARAAVTELASAAPLPRLTSTAACTGNRLYRRQLAWPLPMVGARVVAARWRWREPGSATLEGGARYAFRIGPFGGTLGLSLRAQARLLDEPQADRLPGALRYVLLADALSEVAARLEQALQQRLEWVLPGDDAAAAPIDEDVDGARTLAFELLFDGAARDAADGFVRFDNNAALDACSAACTPLQDAEAPPWDALALPLTFELGRTTLTLRELRGIERGDIVAVERWQPQGTAFEAALVIGRRHRLTLRALADGRRATLLPWKEFVMTSLANEVRTLESPPAAAADRLEALDMPLRFEVGELQLTLRELRSLQPGHVFELEQPLNRSTVRIYAHANLIGHGVLVAVGDRLGVRVSDIAADAHG